MVGKGGAAQITIRSLRKRVLRRHPELAKAFVGHKCVYCGAGKLYLIDETSLQCNKCEKILEILEDNYNLTRSIYDMLEELPWAKYWSLGYRQTTKSAVIRRIYQLKISPSRTKARSCPEVLA